MKLDVRAIKIQALKHTKLLIAMSIWLEQFRPGVSIISTLNVLKYFNIEYVINFLIIVLSNIEFTISNNK